MTTSGTYGFNLTRDDIVTEALIKAGQFDPESDSIPTATQLDQGGTSLNTLLKAWQADGLQIWARRLAVIFLQNGQKLYQLGSDGGTGGDHAALETNQVTTQLAVGGNLGDLSIIVTDSTGISSGDNIGIQLSTNILYWTTVNGTPVNNVVTLSSALTGAASINAVVFDYSIPLARPLRLNDGYMKAPPPANNNTPIRVLSMEEYLRFGINTSTGFTTQVFLHPFIGYSSIEVYPVPNVANYRLYLELHYPFQDFDSGADNPDLPQEWLQAIVWGLAVEFGYSYGVTETRLGMMEKRAEYWHQLALGTSQENSVFFQPDAVLMQMTNHNY